MINMDIITKSQHTNRNFKRLYWSSNKKQILEKRKSLLETDYKDIKLIILGPSAPMVAKVNNKYRFRMIIKCKNNAKFRKMLREAIDCKLAGDVSVSVDINPETVI